MTNERTPDRWTAITQETSKCPDEKELALEDLRSMQDDYIEGDGYERHPLPEWYALEKAIKALERDWIPTRERLPELNINIGTKRYPIMISEPVYITYRRNPQDAIRQNRVCPIPCYYSSNGYWYIDVATLEGYIYLDLELDNSDEPLKGDVVAWRPMFEPYEEVS